VSRAIGRIGFDAVRYGARRALPGSDRRRDAEEFSRALGRHLADAARSMRGSALKLCQMLAWETGLLEEPALAELAKTWYQAQPMPPGVANAVIETELGAAPEALFAWFASTPFAAASLGQVHAARDRRGRELVVKVLYPGIEREIRRDVNDLRDVAMYILRSGLFLELIDEVEARLLEECDYRIEASNLELFRRGTGMKVALPAVVPSRSSAGVLTMTRVGGEHLPDWLAGAPSRRARDDAAQRLSDFFWNSLSDLEAVHADPNPGNFLFQTDGRVGVIDFGNVKRLEPQLAKALLGMISAYRAGEPGEAFDLALGAGMFGGLDRQQAEDVDRQALRPFARWLIAGMTGEPLDFGRRRSHAAEGRALFLGLARANPHAALHADLLFVNRALCGLYQMFSALGTRVDLTPPALRT
jgi:predicted unusual protein kinase regulating ubiquinone biosynthesis (AarF/ABC1/UbiB family)